MSLPDYIAGHLKSPFVWGEHDCITFAVGWLSIKAGRDLLAPYRPWSSRHEAAEAIIGAGGLEAQFDAQLRRIPANLAQDGDITVIGQTTYLFSGSHIVVPGDDGLIFKPRTEATCAWSL